MNVTALLIVAMGMITTLLLFGMIFIGARHQKKMQALEQDLGASTSNLQASATNLQASAGHLMKALEETRQRQAQLMSRLENLEAIVTSEAWEALQAGKVEEARLLIDEIDDGAAPEPSTEEKARHLARRVR